MNISIIIMTYNHEELVCDCLESIKYQINTYKEEGDKVEVIVTDDCSTDDTVGRVKKWEEKNKGIFDKFDIICNENNIGTCNNYENALSVSSGEFIKLVGGDDLFPQNSMFEVFKYLESYDIVTGLPFEYILESNNSPTIIQELSHKNQCVYKELEDKSFYDLIEKMCFLNAPATYIRRDIATNPEVVSFVRSFKFTEDYPQWVKASEIKPIKLKMLNEFTIIYRRTEKSTYIVKRADPTFLNDRVRIYTYLFKRTKNLFTKLIIVCFLFAFKKGRLMPRKYLNILPYIYRYYWYKNRNRITPPSIEIIEDNLRYIKNISYEKSTRITN